VAINKFSTVIVDQTKLTRYIRHRMAWNKLAKTCSHVINRQFDIRQCAITTPSNVHSETNSVSVSYAISFVSEMFRIEAS